jgi:alpha-tubulin suppressor-like RCC1 family protein
MTAGRRLALALALAACAPSRVYHCEADRECVRGGAAGRCIEGGCAFEDGACDSGLRWIAESPASPNECVPTTTPIPDAMPDGGGADGVEMDCLEARQVSAGGSHACLVTTDDEVWCWGANDNRQLGTAAPADVVSPVLVLDGARLVAAGGFHTCAVLLDGAVTCWGANLRGQLGRGSQGDPELADAAQRSLASGVTAIAAGVEHTCAVRDGSVLCWGENFEDQSDPYEGGDALSSPRDPGAGQGGDALALGEVHSVTLDGTSVVTWGLSGTPQLGRGTIATSGPLFVDIRSYRAIAAGFAHTCAIPEEPATVTCWGRSNFGQLGVTGDRFEPTDISVPETPDSLAAGAGHTCALAAASGNLACWGSNFHEQLGLAGGDGQSGIAPRVVHDTIDWRQVSAGTTFTCGLDAGGHVRCWGENARGQLGHAGSGMAALPVDGSCP